MTLQELKTLKDDFEKDGRQALAVHLTAGQAQSLRWELHQLYGFDPGEMLTTLYGMAIAAVDAPTLRFEE